MSFDSSNAAVLEAPTEEMNESSYVGIPEKSSLTGRFRMHHAVESKFLDRSRDVLVYLPPDYETSMDRHYPVLYMHDGQNLMDGATSFVEGNEWRVDETAEEMITKGEVEPLIIVAIYNTGDARIDEYTPSVDRKHQRGGRASDYAKFLIDELKPMIDSTYRTIGDREHTAVAGSSLGGLVSLYLGLRYSQVFGKVAAMSPSVWWDRRRILRLVRGLKTKTGQRVWVDTGDSEGRAALQNVRDLRDLLLAKGWVLGEDLGYLEAKDHTHDERSWAARMGAVLGFLFPRGPRG